MKEYAVFLTNSRGSNQFQRVFLASNILEAIGYARRMPDLIGKSIIPDLTGDEKATLKFFDERNRECSLLIIDSVLVGNRLKG